MSEPQHLARGGRRTNGERAVIGLGAAVSLLLLVGATVVGWFNYKFGQIERFDVSIDIPPPPEEPRNYLLVGSDSRTGLDPDDPVEQRFFDETGFAPTDEGQHTDTIMVLRVDPKAGDAHLVSFPRDLYLRISGRGDFGRINVAFSRGREVLIDTIRDNFGIPIHHYIEVDFVGFLGLVDAIGGVPMYFSEPVRDEFSALRIEQPGCVTLDGHGALAFARSRHLEIQDVDTGRWRADPSGDFGRISRQQEFIRKAIGKAVSQGLTNPVTLNRLVNVGVEFVGLDPTLSVGQIVSLGRRFAAFDPETLKTYSLPARNFRTRAGAAVLDLDERAAEPILNIFRGADPDEVRPEIIEVTALNGTGAQGVANDVTVALEIIGFETGVPGDTVDRFERTAIYYAPGSENAAIRLARHVKGSVQFSIDPELGPNEVVLVVGADFTTLHDQPSPTEPTLPTTTTTTSASASTTAAPASTTSTTEPIGYLPGEAPPGVSCG